MTRARRNRPAVRMHARRSGRKRAGIRCHALSKRSFAAV
ncbi:sperm protamine P1 family protein [Burkholderia ubonensis]|nr:sperm protamine P1 family protein [Burkholderia vietnamiensis]RQM55380.1 sperm protamine P1 family protein [Burkholderia vietnamiensis]TPQ44229.1 sperm protamine P1 family protein [Burkholderia ubonensis]